MTTDNRIARMADRIHRALEALDWLRPDPETGSWLPTPADEALRLSRLLSRLESGDSEIQDKDLLIRLVADHEKGDRMEMYLRIWEGPNEDHSA